jgi:hypothetical protein
MYGPRLCNEYMKELDAFVDFKKKYMLNNVRGNLCCPCKPCKNEKKYYTDDVFILISERAEAEGKEGSYEDYLSCFEYLQE